jgi:hypothetical protein
MNFFKGESDDDLIYSPLLKGARGLFLLVFLYFSMITVGRVFCEFLSEG